MAMDDKELNPIADGHAASVTADEGFDRDDPNAGIIALIGGAIVIIVIAVIMSVSYLYEVSRDEDVNTLVAQPVSQELLNLRAKEDGDLYQYKYIDRKTGAVRLPIDRAMELYAKEAAEGKFKYPTAPAHIKTAAEIAAVPGKAAATPNATPAAK